MDIKEKLKKLDDLNLDEMVEVVKKHYLYVKPEDKEDFLKMICEAAGHLCTDGGFSYFMKKAIEKYADLNYLEQKTINGIFVDDDEIEDVMFLINNLFKYNRVGASVSLVLLQIYKIKDSNCREIMVNLNQVMDVFENCDLFTCPKDENKLTTELAKYTEKNKSKIIASEFDKKIEKDIVSNLISMLTPYLNVNSAFAKMRNRASYQWFDKRFIKKCLNRLDKKQLIDFYILITTFRKDCQLFMSKSSSYDLINEISPADSLDLSRSPRNRVFKALENVDEEKMRGLLYSHADMNLILWDNTLEAFLARNEISDAYQHVQNTLFLKNKFKNTNIDVLI